MDFRPDFGIGENPNPVTAMIFHRLVRFAAPACLTAGLVVQCHAASVCFIPLRGTKGLEGWAFEAGVAMITNSSIEDFPLASVHQASGPAGGEVYSLTASRRIGELRWQIGGHTFTPQLEVPFTLEIVDEKGSSPFPGYNLSFVVRWIDFPWNDYVRTSFSMGLGLSYSQEIYQIDIDRHPNENRSHFKFNWPIQMMLALPDHPQHQLMIFISHHSGGHIFDDGGFNNLGVGYRREF